MASQTSTSRVTPHQQEVVSPTTTETVFLTSSRLSAVQPQVSLITTEMALQTNTKPVLKQLGHLTMGNLLINKVT